MGGALDADDSIALGAGSSDKISVTADYGTGNSADDLFYDDDDSDTTDDPTISGVEIASVTIADSGAATTTDVSSAGFASTLELLGDAENAAAKITGIKVGQTVKIGKTLDLSDNGSVLELTQSGATSSAPTDSLTITSDLLETGTTLAANIDDIDVDTTKSVSLALNSTNTDVATVTLDNFSADKATSVTITSAEKLTIGTIDAADDAVIDLTGVAGETSVTVDTTNDYTVKGSSTAKTTFVMAAGLDADDSIVGGSATTDVLTATANGLTATTGKLSIAGVEDIVLTTVTAASTIDASGITGASAIRFTGAATAGSSNSVDATLTNLAAGTALGLGANADGKGFESTVTVSLADSTGSSDSLTVELGARNEDADIAATLVATGIETLNIKDSATAKDATVDLSGFAASTINITGGKAGELFSTTTTALNAATSTVDASAFLGTLTAKASTNTATTFLAKTAVTTITGGAVNDTITISDSLNASVGTIVGGTGDDTLNVSAKGSSFDLDAVTAVETINITFDAVDGFNFGAGGGSDATISAATVTYAGGKADQLYGVGSTGVLTDIGTRVIDASNLLGSIKNVFGDDGLKQTNSADAVTITGGQSAKDVIDISMSASNTGTFTMSGVENLVAGNITGTSTIDLTNVTGLKDIALHNAAGTGKNFVIDKLTSGTEITLGTSGDEFDDQSVDINLLDATGSSDSITINLVDTDAASSIATIDVDGIETVNLKLADSSEVHKVDIDHSGTGGAKLVVTGANIAGDLTIDNLEAGITTIDASGLTGFLNLDSGARGSAAMTITTGTNDDTIAMENKNDVLNAGEKASDVDTLNVVHSGTGGAIIVDLGASDQISMFNGLANATVQTGFEKVDLSNYVQTNSIGADMTATDNGGETLIGTGYADTIRGGAKVDTLTGGGGADTITAGTGADVITGGTGADTIDVGASGTDLDEVVIAAGDTALTIGGTGNAGTITGYDVITGFADATAALKSDILNVQGTAGIVANTTGVNSTDSTLTISGTAVKSHAISGGIITFDDADTFATALTIDSDAKLAAAVQYMQAEDFGDAGDSVALIYGSDTFVFTQGSDAGTDNSLDILVKITGHVADSLVTTNAAGADDLFIK